eukprot:TRINITY_DN2712_c0_g1_i2.p1 TRINITY_DN2712_c0_g1~~TRINITY_DN2712_c0_g1_i2.p1  ORF type:complete len:323 (-),score=118.36 TRINITY_DN2712_c0_g1_i2:126-968(-)
MDDNLSIGFIGAGMMASALIKGVIKAGKAKPASITASDAYQPSLDRQAAEGVHTTLSNREVVSRSRVVFLAVKPDVVASVLDEIKDDVDPDRHLIVSIAAGISLESMEGRLNSGARVVRVMPNTPCLVSESAAAFALGTHATAEDRALVQELMGSVGYACEVKESQLDAVTGLSGSGPAYVYLLIEALADGGVRMGLPRQVALQLAAQTVKGAATMVMTTGQHPGQLKDAVTSPGGTTIAGIEALEKAGFRGAAMGAVVAATQRSQELKALSAKPDKSSK